MRDGEQLNLQLQKKLEQGEDLVERLIAITEAAKPMPAPRRTKARPITSNPRSVSEIASQATLRLNAMRSNGA